MVFCGREIMYSDFKILTNINSNNKVNKLAKLFKLNVVVLVQQISTWICFGIQNAFIIFVENHFFAIEIVCDHRFRCHFVMFPATLNFFRQPTNCYWHDKKSVEQPNANNSKHCFSKCLNCISWNDCNSC